MRGSRRTGKLRLRRANRAGASLTRAPRSRANSVAPPRGPWSDQADIPSESYFLIARSHWSSVILAAALPSIGDVTCPPVTLCVSPSGSRNFRSSSRACAPAPELRSASGIAESSANRACPCEAYPCLVRSYGETYCRITPSSRSRFLGRAVRDQHSYRLDGAPARTV